MFNIFRLFLSDGVFANAKYNKRTPVEEDARDHHGPKERRCT